MLKIIIFSFFTLAYGNETDHKVHGYKKGAKEEKHDHKKDHKDNHKDEDKDDHKNEHKDEHKDEEKGEHKDEHKDEHGEHGDHDEHANEVSAEGFKLNDASVKTFGLVNLSYSAPSVVVTKEAIFKGLNEVNLYRLRNGFYKRVDFKILSQNKNDFRVSSPDLAAGDQIVVKGIGFLRIAEIAASGGLSDSHSH